MIETENNLLLRLLLLLSVTLVMSYACYELTRIRLLLRRRLKISGIFALGLSIYTLLFLQGHSFLFNQEGIVSSKISHVKNAWQDLREENKKNDTLAYQHFGERFIFVNTADNPALYPLPGSTHLDNAQNALTDRAKLDSLFRHLADKTQIDLVACDVLFSEKSDQDEQLALAMLPLQSRQKLVLAWYKEARDDNDSFYGQFDPDTFGDVTAQQDEPVYYSHQIRSLENNPLSFPYQMHARLAGTNLTKDQSGRYFSEQFVTEFHFIDEQLLYGHSSRMLTHNRNGHPNNSISQVQERHFYTLGRACTTPGQTEIDTAIARIKARGEQVILLIGDFTSDQLDVHQTSYGVMHGVSIILNEFYLIDKRLNTLSYSGFVCYCLFLFWGFFAIISFILYLADRRDRRRPRVVRQQQHHPIGKLLEWGESVCLFVIDEFYYILIFLLALALNLLFHTIVNIIGLIYIIPLLAILLKYYINLHNERSEES